MKPCPAVEGCIVYLKMYGLQVFGLSQKASSSCTWRSTVFKSLAFQKASSSCTGRYASRAHSSSFCIKPCPWRHLSTWRDASRVHSSSGTVPLKASVYLKRCMSCAFVKPGLPCHWRHLSTWRDASRVHSWSVTVPLRQLCTWRDASRVHPSSLA